MIEKIISIKNVGRFRDCSPRGDVTLRKLSLVFAENGRGKTTLCAILHSLQSGRHEYISERKTLGAKAPASVDIRLAGNTVSFSNNAWSGTCPDIAIFDSVFVHDNVYAGDYVDHEHKKNLYRVVVGAHGAQLAHQVDALDEQIRTVNADIKTKKDAVSGFVPPGVTVEAYLAWQAVHDVDVKIQKKANEVAKRQLALHKAAEIRSKALLANIRVPSLPSDVASILAKQLTDITADAEACVRQQLAHCEMGSQGEAWLSQGLGYVKNDLCPFCGQDIHPNDLIAAYRSHFNTAYKALKQEVAQLSQRINTAIGDFSLMPTQQTISGNLALAEFWRQFAEVTLPDLPFADIQRMYAGLREQALALAKNKQDSPSEPVPLDAAFSSALADVERLRQTVDAYNAAVEICNMRINEQKTSVQQGGDMMALKNELAELEAKKKRFERGAVQACQAYRDSLAVKSPIEQKKEKAKEALDLYCQGIMGKCQKAMNDYLDQFNAGFRIVNTKHDYRGGTPRSVFQIQINNTAIDVGDSKTSAGTPCFKTTLSSGDRSALALAFFVTALRQDASIGSKIVVLDDPFTSLDRFRRTCTQQIIQKLAGATQQVIVLSHDAHFLKLIWDAHSSHDIKNMQLYPSGDNTMIGEWDIEAETQSTYHKNHADLLNYYRDRTGTPLNVARAIRPFIEGLLRVHFPGHFQPNEWLGAFIDKIRGADSNSGLQHAQADLAELEDINDYSKKYHHDQNPNADSEPISQDELHGFVKRTLRLAGGC